MSRRLNQDKAKLLNKLETTPIAEIACKQAGIPRSTYYRWRKSDEDFAKQCDETIEESAGRISDLAESQLINAIKERNMTAIMFWLKHHHRAYKNKLEIDARLTGVQQALSPEQAELVSQALRLAGLINSEGENQDETI